MRAVVINVLIDLPANHPYHRASLDAIRHASAKTEIPCDSRAIPTSTINPDDLVRPGSAVLVGPGSPYTNPEGAYAVIRAARERGVPLVGT